MHDTTQLLHHLFQAAVSAADPAAAVRAHAPAPPSPGHRTVVVGAGKAVRAMAEALVALPGFAEVDGLIIAPHGTNLQSIGGIEVRGARHPLPDAAGAEATARVHYLATTLEAGDRLIVLLSGGGSSLLTLPRPGLGLDQKQDLTSRLMGAGATIQELNAVRRHLSVIKGGQLALAAWPAQVETLAISDVVGDDPAVIASGPTVADPTTAADALAVLERYGITPPRVVAEGLSDGGWETPKPGDAKLDRSHYTLVARPMASLEAAAEAARAAGITPLILGDSLEGESRELGRMVAGLARSILAHGQPVAAPCVVLSGGETTVTLQTLPGRGGPNTECALGFALAMEGMTQADRQVAFLAADTDGVDGYGGHAGAVVLPDTLARARTAGLDPRARLLANDSASVFQAAGTLMTPGATGTNVNDFRALLIR